MLLSRPLTAHSLLIRSFSQLSRSRSLLSDSRALTLHRSLFSRRSSSHSPIPFKPLHSSLFSSASAPNSHSSGSPSDSSSNVVSPVVPLSIPAIYRLIPPQYRPYADLARLDKPIGTWLLLYPCLWSVAVASPVGSLPGVAPLLLFSAGAFIMRGAGCTINDLWDRRYDGKVERTKTRPIASGALSERQALGFLLVQLLGGLAVVTQFDFNTILLSFASIPIVIVYPLMKRFFPVPQAVLGLAFNWGAFVGFSAVAGSVNSAICLPLYLTGIGWTIVYDTIYAHQDKTDDKKLGLRSSALTFGDATKPILTGTALASYAACSLFAHNAGLSTIFDYGSAAAFAHMLYVIWSADINSPESCRKKFIESKWFGLIIFLAIVLDRAIAEKQKDKKLESSEKSQI